MSNPTTESEDFDLELPGKPKNPDGTPMRPQGPVNHDVIQTFAGGGTSTRPTGPVNHDVVLPAGDKLDRPMGPVNHDVVEAGDGEDDGGATTDGPVNHDQPTGP